MRGEGIPSVGSRSVVRFVLAGLLAAATALALVPAALAQWPTSCVELNDIVENHLGNQQNVGIYQRAFGAQAEQACQNDHRDDVRSAFAWAFDGPTASATAPAPTQWPAACVALNDIVEAYLGNLQNVGIYQSVYGAGAQAERACQADHRIDVRGVFAWAFSAGSPAPTPVPTTPPQQAPEQHPDYERVRQTAIARGATPEHASQIAVNVIQRGAVEAFLAGTDTGVQYGVAGGTPAASPSALQSMTTREFFQYIRSNYGNIDGQMITYKELRERESKPDDRFKYSDELSVTVNIELTRAGRDAWRIVSQSEAEAWAERLLADIRARWPDRHAGGSHDDPDILWSLYLVYRFDTDSIALTCNLFDDWCSDFYSEFSYSWHVTHYYVKSHSWSDDRDSIRVRNYR